MRLLKLATVVLLIVTAVGCETKQEAARTNLSTTWRIDQVTRAGVDDTQDYTESRSNYRISFTKEGTFQERYTSFGSSTVTEINGSWTINSNVTTLNLETDFSSRAFSIDLLESTNFNVTDQGEPDDLKLFFVPA